MDCSYGYSNYNTDGNYNYQMIDVAHLDYQNSNAGKLIIAAAPGKKDNHWNRNLLADLNCIKNKKVGTIVCLLEWTEMDQLNISDYPKIAQENKILFYHFPIKDMTAPHLRELQTLIPLIIQQLITGKNILVHCRAGLGRAGTVCACCLLHFGFTAAQAITIIRKRRPGAIQTIAQEQIVEKYERTIKI